MTESSVDRKYTAYHEAGHAVAYLHYNVWPDGMELYDDLSGKVHLYRTPGQLERIREIPEIRRQLAIQYIAGPIAELISKGIHDLDCGLITGSSSDLDGFVELYPDKDERFLLQLEAIDIIEQHWRLWHVLARLVDHLGYVHRDDLILLWMCNRGVNLFTGSGRIEANK